MNRNVPSLALVERVRAGEPAAVARLISRAEAGSAEARDALAAVYRLAGKAHVVGITGAPGSGKSTLVGKLAERLRSSGGKIGIVAIDPSSPYTGGAILGDRLRMADSATDPGIYIRSMATGGATGGMARAALDAVDILDVAGFDTIIVETVGVGQDEVEIALASHTTIVVSAPGLGDEIQAIKAGILEIADIHAVSKCDRPDAHSTVSDLKHMVAHGERGAWRPPVVATSSVSGQGIDDLVAAIGQHRAIAFDPEQGRARLAAIANFRLRKTAENLLLEDFAEDFADRAAAFAGRLAGRDGDPYSFAQNLLHGFFSSRRTDRNR